jgi:hypothetical protein
MLPPEYVDQTARSGRWFQDVSDFTQRPELTAEKFVPNPYAHIAGDRMYRTGDLGRYRPDGTVEFHGRVDQQVKVRGYRIEPEEIEAALREHPAIAEAVVIVREDRRGDKRLVAYIVPFPQKQKELPDQRQLHQHLRQKLPEYMVPSAVMWLSTLPLSPNGKLDRRALPVIENTAELRSSFIAPRSPMEELIAGLWAEILEVEQVGVQHNFFTELGGHSLLAAQAVFRMRDILEMDIPMRTIFEAPSAESWAQSIIQSSADPERLLEIARLANRIANMHDTDVEKMLAQSRPA